MLIYRVVPHMKKNEWPLPPVPMMFHLMVSVEMEV